MMHLVSQKLPVKEYHIGPRFGFGQKLYTVAVVVTQSEFPEVLDHNVLPVLNFSVAAW